MIAALACVQLASDSIFSRSAAPFSLPAKIPANLGIAIYSAIERGAPAPYVEAMLAQAALNEGMLSRAQAFAGRMPASPAREELLGKIALARGDEHSAEIHFIAAADAFAIRAETIRLAKKDPAAAYRLELAMRDRLTRTATLPDLLADAYWRLGILATQLGYRAHELPMRHKWFETGMRDYVEAVALSPISEKYLIYAGSQALNLNNPIEAQQYFRRAVNQNPASADAYAGLGVAALRLGDRQSGLSYARLSAAYNPRSHFLHTLEALLK